MFVREREAKKAGRQAAAAAFLALFTYKYVLFWGKFSKYIFS